MDTTLSPPDATLVIELVAFLIVLAVIAKFVVPRMRATVQQRQARISNALAAADDADRRRQAIEIECRELVAEARREARAITDGARAMKEHLIAEGRREGQAEYVWRAERIDRELRRDDEQIRRRLALEATQTVLNAIREISDDETDAARLAGIVSKAMMSAARPALAGRATAYSASSASDHSSVMNGSRHVHQTPPRHGRKRHWRASRRPPRSHR